MRRASVKPLEAQIIVWDLARPGKERVSRIMAHLLERRYNMLVLAKCGSRSVPMLVEALEDAGYCVLLGAPSFQPSLLVATLPNAEIIDWPSPTDYEHRWLPFRLSLSGGSFVNALAVHIPYAGEADGLEGKRRY